MPIDYEALFGVVDYDPCEALRALRPAYMKLLAGEHVQKVAFRDREVWKYGGDLKAFGLLIAQLENDCASSQGRAPNRRAITAGARRS